MGQGSKVVSRILRRLRRIRIIINMPALAAAAEHTPKAMPPFALALKVDVVVAAVCNELAAKSNVGECDVVVDLVLL